MHRTNTIVPDADSVPTPIHTTEQELRHRVELLSRSLAGLTKLQTENDNLKAEIREKDAIIYDLGQQIEDYDFHYRELQHQLRATARQNRAVRPSAQAIVQTREGRVQKPRHNFGYVNTNAMSGNQSSTFKETKMDTD